MIEVTMLLNFITAIDVAHIKTHIIVLVIHSSLNTIFKYQKINFTFIEAVW